MTLSSGVKCQMANSDRPEYRQDSECMLHGDMMSSTNILQEDIQRAACESNSGDNCN